MVKLLLVGVGGFIGSILRYSIGGYIQQWANDTNFPYGTLLVNLIGCFLIGFLAQLAQGRASFTSEVRALVLVGVLGGFTTFSSFGNETVELWQGKKEVLAIVNITGHLVLGLSGVWLGRVLGQWIGS